MNAFITRKSLCQEKNSTGLKHKLIPAKTTVSKIFKYFCSQRHGKYTFVTDNIAS